MHCTNVSFRIEIMDFSIEHPLLGRVACKVDTHYRSLDDVINEFMYYRNFIRIQQITITESEQSQHKHE